MINEAEHHVTADTIVADLGTLPTEHAVGLAVNPTDDKNVFFADETALYQFNKETGKQFSVM